MPAPLGAVELLSMEPEVPCEHEWHRVVDVCKDKPCAGTTLGIKCAKCGMFNGSDKAVRYADSADGSRDV